MVFKESDMDKIKYFKKVQNEILRLLKERYAQYGNKNFVFKSKRLSRELPYNSKIIGRTLASMHRNENIITVEKSNKVPILWRTNFDNKL